MRPRRTRIKVCGMTRLQEALEIAEMGVDGLGFIFWKRSPRSIAPSDARAICAALPPFVTRVGVFVDAPLEEMEEVARLCRLDLLQLHGQEPPELCRSLSRPCIKAVRLRGREELERLAPYRGAVVGFLLDAWSPGAPGGTGLRCDWDLAREAVEMDVAPVVLAGGLGPQNVAEAVARVGPWGVDLNSGVELEPGRKDPTLVARAVEMVHRADQDLGRG